MTRSLSDSVALASGAVLSNRLVKAAMSEGIADANNDATPRLVSLYRRWSESGAGMLLTGNMQVDRHHLERPGNIVLDINTERTALKEVAQAGTIAGNHLWMQLSHTGRQVSSAINPSPLAPSSIAINVPPGLKASYARPRAMSEAEIVHAIGQFAIAARSARETGFTGVQLHAAHGYLISQFLSPLANRRTDAWGGSLKNRARFLLETISAVRKLVGADFPIAIKLNSSDFQKGGFTNEECVQLVGWLNETSLDLLELSGGSLEQPKVVGVSIMDEGVDARPESTIRREAYFIDYAARVRAVAKMPVMVTGGFRTVSAMTESLRNGELDIVGLGRPMLIDTKLPSRILNGRAETAPTPEAALNVFHLLPWFNAQLERLADGLEPDLGLTGEDSTALFATRESTLLSELLDQRRSRRFA